MSQIIDAKLETISDLYDDLRLVSENSDLIIASNRGPVEHQYCGDTLKVLPGNGGLVTALSSLSNLVSFTWVANAVTDGDRRAARHAHPQPVTTSFGGKDISLRYVVNPHDDYEKYYSVLSNPFLWFIQHYMWDTTYETIDRGIYDAWDSGYMPVNRAFADAIVKEAKTLDNHPLIMLHDYQLYMVGAMVRGSLPEARIQHFVHIPWPAPRHWTLVPQHMRSQLLESLCSCDVVGFQTSRDAENFLLSCRDHLPGAIADLNSMTVRFQGRVVRVRDYPVGVDVVQLQADARSSMVVEYEDRLRKFTSRHTIVRVDRLDPTKNVLRGFQAYELLLERFPEFIGNVSFLAFLVPSRTQIDQYRTYTEAVLDIVGSINDRFGTPDWNPIRLFLEDNRLQALAGMRLADVLLVNPVIDGMNLVAKEGPTVNNRDGVLILSEGAGAYQQLRDGAIPVSPVDIEETANALHSALTMDRNERSRKIRQLRKVISEENVAVWLHRQIRDLTAVAN